MSKLLFSDQTAYTLDAEKTKQSIYKSMLERVSAGEQNRRFMPKR